MILFFVGLIIGAIAVVAAEAATVLYVINRLNKKTKALSSSVNSSSNEAALDPLQSLDFAFNKQGYVWVLEPDDIPKEKVSREQKKRKELVEVYPIRKYARIKDRALVLKDSDGSQVAVPLDGCVIEAVSALILPSRKWAKRFPVKVENKTSKFYNGSKIIYIYLETSWEKESWCKALRIISCEDKKTLNWFAKLSEGFRNYLVSLNAGYPSFMKPSMRIANSPLLIADHIDRATRLDGSSSKVRLFWKKLARKTSKPCVENKALHSSYSGREDRKIYEKLQSSQDIFFGASSGKSGTTKAPNDCGEEKAKSPSSTFPHSESQSQFCVAFDADSDDKFLIDEGTLCWNLLIFRLFFDAKSNVGMKNSIQARIQRTLLNMRTPSYIGEIICTDVDIGNLPPYVHGMRVLPTEMNEVWAFEVDMEYSGGVVLDVETRIEVRELDVPKGIVDSNGESSSVPDVSSDLLEGFGKQLNVSEGTTDGQVRKDEGDPNLDSLKNNKSIMSTSTFGSRWKSILNSVAKQVSQVPISLSIRVASLRGTLRLHIKPPPSDQLWFGFTSMPDIEFNLESSVGDHKITSGHVALFLINRFKAAIRETMVLPNCESVCIPWMLGEKDDWVPRNVAPFIWLSQVANNDSAPACEASSSRIAEAKTKQETTKTTKIENPDCKHQNPKQFGGTSCSNAVSRVASMPRSSSSIPSIQNSKSLQELRTPLLAIEGTQETCSEEEILEGTPSTSLTQLEKQNISIEDDSKPKKLGRRARMLDLGKKMGEKLEEKRRHIEERVGTLLRK